MQTRGFSFLLYGFILMACHTNQPEAIIGRWQVDSVATFYNGFTYQSAARHWNETYQYDTSQVVVQKDEDFQRWGYRINQDTLQYFNTQQIPVSQFRILRLNNEQMVLRKEHAPLWKGPEQTRYEIRYFTRLDTATSVSSRLLP